MRNTILVIDDLRYFGDTFEDKKVVYVRTVMEATHFILNNWDNIAELWLDHDLGFDHANKRWGDTPEVLDFIAERLFSDWSADGRTVRMVTSNPAGRRDMETWANRWKFTINPTIPEITGWIDNKTGELLKYE